MIVFAQQKIGPFLVRVEWWSPEEVGLSIMHDSFDQRTYLSANEARGLFDFLLLHIRQLEAEIGGNETVR